MANILHHESDVSQPFIIITGNHEQITKMAWADVLRLCFYRGIDHVSLWQHLPKHCAQTTLKKRLASLGMSVGKEIEVLETTLQKNTIKVGIGLGSIALRLDEAKCVNVEAIHA